MASRRAAKRAAAKGIAAAPPRESGWAKSDHPGTPRWARPPNAVQAAQFEARRLHNARQLSRHRGQNGANDGVGGGVGGGLGGGVGGPASAMEAGASPEPPVHSPTPPGGERQASTAPRRKPTPLPRQLQTPRTAPPDASLMRQNKLYHQHVTRKG